LEHEFRQALVAYLAEKHGANGSLGKKAVQKYVHILSSLSGKNLGYDFSFYTYGPFSRDLASDLDLLSSAGLLDITYNSSDNAYSIRSTPAASALVAALPNDIRSVADNVWDRFSGRTAKQLELTSTILFVHDEESIAPNANEMTERVKALKPKYSIADIKQSQSEVAALL
jgi:uncharacterized protein YwgA